MNTTDLPVPAWRLAPGDRIKPNAWGTVRVVKSVIPAGDRIIVTIDGFNDVIALDVDAHAEIPLRSPDVPTDGWTTHRDPTGAHGPLGCTCVYRQTTPFGTCERIGDDPGCRFHHPDDEGD